MAKKMKPRQRKILQALTDLGGQGAQSEIAEMTNLPLNGVSRSLGALQAQGKVHMIDSTSKDSVWAIWAGDGQTAEKPGEQACRSSS